MKNLTLCLALFLPIFLSAQWMQVGQNLNGSYGDIFGASVTISSDGSFIAVGAPKYNHMKGIALIFEWHDGQWEQVGDSIVGENFDDHFGHSLSLSADGTRVAIGAFANDDKGFDAGHAKVYEFKNNRWIQLGNTMKGDSMYHWFGNRLTLSDDGKRVAVGAPCTGGTIDAPGYVRVYEERNGNWLQVGDDLVGESENDLFGNALSMAMNGKRIAIGGQGNDGSFTGAGHVRIFQEINESWHQIGEDLNGKEEGELFGYAVSLSANGTRLAVGAPYNDDVAQNAGQVRIHELNNGKWIELGSFISGEEVEGNSGWSVSFTGDGNVLSIGAWEKDSNGEDAGQVNIYKYHNGTWQHSDTLNGEHPGDLFGTHSKLSLNGNRLIVSAPRNDDNGNLSGQVRVFEYSPVAVDEADRSGSLDVYPNPTSGHVLLDLGDIYSSIDITVRSVTGERVDAFHYSNRRSIDLDIIGPSGVYLLDVVLDGSRKTVRVVVD